MPYTRPYTGGFIDYPNTTTPLTASALNTMDLGIKGAYDQIQTLTTTQRNAISSPSLGQLVWDSDLEELFVYLNGAAGNGWFGLGNYIICTSTTRPATPVVGMRIYETDTRYNYTYIAGAWTPSGDTVICTVATRPASPPIGQIIYQTDTDEVLKYVTDADGTARWMLADHDYRRNVVINGGFDVWQRGTSFNPTSATSTSTANYAADRWQFLQATTSAAAFTRQAITSSDPAGFNYYTRVQRANTLTLTTAYTVQTSFESQNIQQFRGKYVTLSFWARAGANYSAASSFLVSDIVTGTGTDNTVGNFTTNTVNTTTNNVLTTSWKRFAITTSAVLATTITQLGVRFVFTPVGTAGAADYFDITGVQVEPASAPSDFEFRDFGEELRRCQRYYYRLGPYGSTGLSFGVGFMRDTSLSRVETRFPVTMRTIPVGVETSGTANHYGINYLTLVGSPCSSIPAFYSATQEAATTTFVVPGPLTNGYCIQGVNGTTAAYLGWSAEL